MIIRFRIDSNDDEDEDGWSGDDAEDATQPWTFRNPSNLGGVFIRAALVFAAVTVLSMIALIVVVLNAAEEPFVDQPTVEEPISGWIWFLLLTGTAVSVIGYTAWSFWKQRQLKKQMAKRGGSSPFKKPIRAVQIATADDSELNEYEIRVQKTVTAFVLTVFLGNIPVRIFLNAFLPP